MLKYEIKNRFTGKIKFTAEIECPKNAPPSMKLGLAIKWGIKARANLADANLAGANLADANLARADLADANLADANLAGADLAGANLARANLADANLAGANLADANLADANLAGANLADTNLIDGGQRSDGYRFVGWIKDGHLWIIAGCRNFNLPESRDHWTKTRAGTPLGDETFAILDHIEKVATIRGMIDGGLFAREVHAGFDGWGDEYGKLGGETA